MSYITKLVIDEQDVGPIGSSLYGECTSDDDKYNKTVVLPNFDERIPGVTIHVKFTNGNSVPLTNPSDNTEHLTLTVGTTDAIRVMNPGGNMNWSAGTVISFTLDYTKSNYTWIVNDSDSGQQVTIEQNYNNPSSSNAISPAGVTDALNRLGNAIHKDVITEIIESGNSANSTSTDLPTTAAVVGYVQDKTAGLTGAMHFIGISTTTITDGGTQSPSISGYNYTTNPLATGDHVIAGDVVLYRDNQNVIGQEYVWTGSAWELLGDEGSYLLSSSVENTSVINDITFSAGTLPVVTIGNETSILTEVSNVPRAARASVAQGVLNITTGILPSFGSSTIKGVISATEGTAPSLTPTTINVLKRVSST